MEMMIRRHLARVNYNVVTNAFAGRFVTLAEDIVFEGATLPQLRADGARKLVDFLASCVRRGQSPYRIGEGVKAIARLANP